MKGRIILIIFSFCFSSLMMHANTTSFSDSYQGNYHFAIVKSATADEQRTNYVLQQISYDNSISFSDLHLELQYVLKLKTRHLSNRQSEISLIVKTGAISGDIQIKQMDVSGQLMPTLCSFEYRLFNKQTGKLYIQELIHQPLQDGLLKIKHRISEHLKKEELGLEFYGLNFYYSEKDVNALKSFISLIEDYYASARLADSLLYKASKWRPDIERDLVFNYLKISEFKRVCSVIEYKEFEKVLNLKKFDPAALLGKLDQLSAMNRRLQTLLNDGLKAKKLHFPNERLLAQQVVDCQRQYEGFLKGSDFNNTHFLDELSQINYSNVWFLNIHSFFAKGLNKSQQKRVNEYFERFVTALRKVHQDVANQLLHSKSFMKANIHIENAKRLHGTLTEADKKALNDLKSRAIYGLYHSYLSIAYRALSVPNVELARLYLDKALNYQKQNTPFILHDDAVDNAYRQLISQLIAKAAHLKMENHFPEASSTLMDAIDLSVQLKAYDLEQNIKDELYDIYKLESFLIMKLNDNRIFAADIESEEAVENELLRLKGSQQTILNQLERLNRDE